MWPCTPSCSHITGSPTLKYLEDWGATARGWVATSGQMYQPGPGEEAVQKKAQVERTVAAGTGVQSAVVSVAESGVLAGWLTGEPAEELSSAADHASCPRLSEQLARCH